MSDKTTKITMNKKGQVIKKEIKDDLYHDTNVIHMQENNGGYWGGHPDYPVDDWKYQVANSETRQDYWEWVLGSMDADGEDV